MDALHQAEELLFDVNEAVRDSENRARLLHYQGRLDWSNLSENTFDVRSQGGFASFDTPFILLHSPWVYHGTRWCLILGTSAFLWATALGVE